jgi:hypothetical protein
MHDAAMRARRADGVSPEMGVLCAAPSPAATAVDRQSRREIRGHPGPLQAQRRPRLLRQETGRGQDRQRSAARPQTPGQRRLLQAPQSRRRPQWPGSGRASGERLCRQRGRLTPRMPALRPGHSRTTSHPTTTAGAGEKEHVTGAKKNHRKPLTQRGFVMFARLLHKAEPPCRTDPAHLC